MLWGGVAVNRVKKSAVADEEAASEGVVTWRRIDRLGVNVLPAKEPAKGKAMPYWNKINEIIMTQEGNWIDAQKTAAGGRRRRRRRQRGGQKGKYGKPGIGSEDSLCGAYQTVPRRNAIYSG